MICKMNGLLKLYVSDFSLHVPVLLLLMFSCGGDSQETGTSQQVVAMLGDDTTLPCYLEKAGNAGDLTLEWARSDLDPRFVLLRRGGVELQHEKNQMYAGRSSLSTEKLKCGDVSLKLSEAKLTDSGTYRCLVPTTSTDSEIQLTVGSVSSPIIHISAISNGVSLDCKSKGWYPKPEVLWLDSKGKILSAKPAETLRGPDGLFTVSSRLSVEKKDSNSFTCRVHQENINQTRESQIHVPVELFLDRSSSAVRIIICLILCIIPVVAVVLVVRKWGRDKKSDRGFLGERQTKSSYGKGLELQLLMDGQGDGGQSRTGKEKIKYLDSTKVKLEEELEKTEGEFKHVEEVITTLTEQRKDLKTQREKLISLQQDDKVKIEENKKKLKDIPKTGIKDKMKKREKTKEDLAKRQTEHDELLKTTETLMESTDRMINKMTERKGKLEQDKEQIKKYLKEIQRQREETQREETQREETQREETQREQTQREQTQREETQREETQREQTQREQTQREQTQREQTQREQTQREQTQREQTQREQTQREQTQREQTQRELEKQQDQMQLTSEQPDGEENKPPSAGDG